MSEAKENCGYFLPTFFICTFIFCNNILLFSVDFNSIQPQKQKGRSNSNPQPQKRVHGRLASDLKNIRPKKLNSDSTVDTLHSPVKFVQKSTEMEVSKQSQQNAGIYPTIPQDEVQQNDQQTTGG